MRLPYDNGGDNRSRHAGGTCSERWQVREGMNEIIHGNCLDVLPTLPTGSVDLILTDPPYGTTKLKLENAFDIADVLPELKRVLKPNGWFFCFASFELGAVIHNSQAWRYKFRYIWVKSHPAPKHGTSKRPMHIYEDLFVFNLKTLKLQSDMYFDNDSIRTSGSAYKQKSGKQRQFGRSQNFGAGVLTVNDGYREGVDVVYFPSKTQMPKSECMDHPTQKPLELCKLIVRGYCRPNGLVIDPFGGSGTTAVAAKLTGRRYVSIERDSKYHAITKHRLGESVPELCARNIRPAKQKGLF